MRLARLENSIVGSIEKIKVESLTYAYPFSDKNALENICFPIMPGECVGIIGRKETGKSTLCLALTGLVPKFFKGRYSGKVLLDGEDVLQNSYEKLVAKIGLVLQNPFSQITGARITVYEEVAFGLENLAIPRDGIKQRVEAVLKCWICGKREMRIHSSCRVVNSRSSRLRVCWYYSQKYWSWMNLLHSSIPWGRKKFSK